MGFFDFLASEPPYREEPLSVLRLNRRHRFLVAPFAEVVRGARVLDLAAHDGRWSLAFAAAGAREVVGIEARAALVARFDRWRHVPGHERVVLRRGGIFAELEKMVARGVHFDIVALFGILYHVMDHMRLMLLVRALAPRLVIVDSEFLRRPGPVIGLVRERTDNPLNAVPQYPGQEVALKGIPSFPAFERMAEAAGFAVEWHDWFALPEGARRGVRDYFRQGEMRRGSCTLRPVAGPGPKKRSRAAVVIRAGLPP